MASQPIKPAGRLRQAGWAAVLTIAGALFLALTFHVNAIKSDVRLAERKIIAMERQKMLLETEFQSRASQRQLAEWNAVEFGYVAPRADQFLDSERQLAMLGAPRRPDAPQPIRVARAEPVAPPPSDSLTDWVAPLAVATNAAAKTDSEIGEIGRRAAAAGAANLAQRLASAGPGPGREIVQLAEGAQ